MRTALDSNILSSLLSAESSASSILTELDNAKLEGPLLISPVVYAEMLAHPMISDDQLREFLTDTDIRLEFEMAAAVWTDAGHRYRAYAIRRRKSAKEQPRRILADFLIGAHASLYADRLMTIDVARYKRDFPDLRLYDL